MSEEFNDKIDEDNIPKDGILSDAKVKSYRLLSISYLLTVIYFGLLVLVTLGHVLLLFWDNLPTTLDWIAEFYPAIIYATEYLALLAFGIVFIVTSSKLIKSHEGKSIRRFTAIIIAFTLMFIIIPIEGYLDYLLFFEFGLSDDLWGFVFFSLDFLYALMFVIVILISYLILPNNNDSKKRTKILVGAAIGSVLLWGILIIISYLLAFSKYNENSKVLIILSLTIIAAQGVYAILGFTSFFAFTKEMRKFYHEEKLKL